MDAELRFHIEAYADDLVRGGVSRKEAMRRARQREGREAPGVRVFGLFVDSAMTEEGRDFHGVPGYSQLRNAGANRKVRRREPLLFLSA